MENPEKLSKKPCRQVLSNSSNVWEVFCEWIAHLLLAGLDSLREREAKKIIYLMCCPLWITKKIFGPIRRHVTDMSWYSAQAHCGCQLCSVMMWELFRNIQITPKDKTDYIRDSVQAGISGLMNLASQGGDPNSNLLFVNFNQDCT